MGGRSTSNIRNKYPTRRVWVQAGTMASNAKVVMKDDAELDTYSPSGDETKLESSVLGDELMTRNPVGTQDEICISNSHLRHESNTKMLFL
jgi:hypothetical protein